MREALLEHYTGASPPEEEEAPPAAAAGGGFPSDGNGPSTNGFLWEPITVQDASGAPQTLFEGPTVEDGHGADMPLPPTLDLFDLFAM